jgi:hypothetical protein
MFWSNEDADYEFNAREDYVRELQAEHFDPWWDVEPEDVPSGDDNLAEH